MTITIEPTDKFPYLPENYQRAAKEFLIGREFDSPSEALYRLNEQLGEKSNIRFYIETISVRPAQLPIILTRIPIKAILMDEEEDCPYQIDCLVAKIVKPSAS